MDPSRMNRRGFLGTAQRVPIATGLAFAAQTSVTAQAQDTNSAASTSGSNPQVLIRPLPRTGELVTARVSAPS